MIKINDNLERTAKTLYDYWFVQFDFPDENGKPYKSSGGNMIWNEILKREIPEGWEVNRLGDISFVNAGGDKPKKFSMIKNTEFSIPVYSNGISDNGMYGFTNLPKIIKPSITISARGTIGYCCLRMSPYYPIIRLITVTPFKDNLELFFLHEIQKLVFENSGSVQQQLTVPQVSNLYILNPDEQVLRDFYNFSKFLIDKIELNKIENQQLSSLRDWLLPMLMNGQVKVE
nr:restriction endonuclease subunit S [uncultured Chryseobacterium sp.]